MKITSLLILVMSSAFLGCDAKENLTIETAAADAPVKKTVEPPTKLQSTANSLTSSGTAAVKKVVEGAAAKGAEIDFSNLSWDQVSNVSFEDKMKLATWATGQAGSWKEKIMDAAKGQGLNQGLNMLGKMGGSGWQSALSKVMESIDAVRESSPQTYELARGALISAWSTFEKKASTLLEK